MEKITYFVYDEQGKSKDIERSLVDEFLALNARVFVKTSMPISKATRKELQKELPLEFYYLGYPQKTDKFFIAPISLVELNTKSFSSREAISAESMTPEPSQTQRM